jgi:hypothetical protein
LLHEKTCHSPLLPSYSPRRRFGDLRSSSISRRMGIGRRRGAMMSSLRCGRLWRGEVVGNRSSGSCFSRVGSLAGHLCRWHLSAEKLPTLRSLCRLALRPRRPTSAPRWQACRALRWSSSLSFNNHVTVPCRRYLSDVRTKKPRSLPDRGSLILAASVAGLMVSRSCAIDIGDPQGFRPS